MRHLFGKVTQSYCCCALCYLQQFSELTAVQQEDEKEADEILFEILKGHVLYTPLTMGRNFSVIHTSEAADAFV